MEKIITEMTELKNAFEAASKAEREIVSAANHTLQEARFFQWRKKRAARQEKHDAQLETSRMKRCMINIQNDIGTLKKAFQSAAADKEKGQKTVLMHLRLMHDAMKAWARGTRTDTYQGYAAKLKKIRSDLAGR